MLRPEPAPDERVGGRVRWSFVSSASGFATSLVSNAVIGRFVSPDEYGRFAVILATWGLHGTVIDWCGHAMMRFGPVELQERASLVRTLSARLALSAPPLVLAIALAPPFLAAARGWPAALVALTVVS